MASWLDGFLSKSQFEAFFAGLDAGTGGFDVLNLPASLWPNLYLLHVQDDGSLLIAVAGDNLNSTMARDLKAADLTRFLHGPSSDHVVASFRRCVDEKIALCLRNHVHIKDKGLTRVVEGAIAPIEEGGAVRKIAGCLYFYDLDYTEFGRLADLCSIRPQSADAA